MFFKSTREDPPQEETQEARIVENAVKKKKSRQKFMTLAGKVVKEVLGGGGNNATEIPVPKPKGQKMRTYGRGGAGGTLQQKKRSSYRHSQSLPRGGRTSRPPLPSDAAFLASLAPPLPNTSTHRGMARLNDPYVAYTVAMSDASSSRQSSASLPLTNVTLSSSPSATRVGDSPTTTWGRPNTPSATNSQFLPPNHVGDYARAKSRQELEAAYKESIHPDNQFPFPEPSSTSTNRPSNSARDADMEWLLSGSATVVGFPTTPSARSFAFDIKAGRKVTGQEPEPEASPIVRGRKHSLNALEHHRGSIHEDTAPRALLRASRSSQLLGYAPASYHYIRPRTPTGIPYQPIPLPSVPLAMNQTFPALPMAVSPPIAPAAFVSATLPYLGPTALPSPWAPPPPVPFTAMQPAVQTQQQQVQQTLELVLALANVNLRLTQEQMQMGQPPQ